MNYYLIVGLSLLFLSCRKDEDIITTGSNCYCCEQVDAPDQIEFGNLDGMNILYPDSIITTNTYPNSSTVYYELDVDQDGINDIKFSKEVIGSYSTGPSPQTKIELLNNETWLAVSDIPDTLYYFEIDLFHSTSPVIQDRYQKTSCLPNSTSDSVISTSNYALYFANGDSLTHQLNWSSEIKIPEHYNANFPYLEDSSNPDTTIYYHSYHYNDCNDIPYNTSIYLGIKKYYCGEEKLGWIKLNLGDYELHIQEIAIQK